MTVLPLQTERLAMRVMRMNDAPALAAYRDVPEIARYQSWPLPFTIDDATQMLQDQADLDDLPPSGWVQVAIEHLGDVIGDLAVNLMADGCVAEIGFTLAPAQHGKGYASEAAGAMIDALFAQTKVHRIAASIDPANVASMRVLEHLGFRYEGTARRAELVRGEWVDDMRFALLRDDRTDWLARPTSCQTVELVEITTDNLQATVSLATHRYQEQFVAPMARSFSQALIPPMHNDQQVVPWMRAVQADDEIVGFMMLSAASPGEPVPYLWRFLIDRRHQRRGVGRRAIGLLADQMRADGHHALMVSWEEGPGGPRPFYEGLGFVPTGVVVGGETEARLDL
ncbi:MAG TPA: GNAT family N-acetyltransferase [Ilumatobacteraceae bacterium]|nr:GNAT family N-acetyltransferase [Ilumatobacteraceae bacterium]